MERKSQFLLWLETLFLKLDFLNTVHELLLQESVPGQVLGAMVTVTCWPLKSLPIL